MTNPAFLYIDNYDAAEPTTDANWVNFVSEPAASYVRRQAAAGTKASARVAPAGARKLIFRGVDCDGASGVEYAQALERALADASSTDDDERLWAAISRYGAERATDSFPLLRRFCDRPFSHSTWQATLQTIDAVCTHRQPAVLDECLSVRVGRIVEALLDVDIVCNPQFASLASAAVLAQLHGATAADAVGVRRRVDELGNRALSRFVVAKCRVKLLAWQQAGVEASVPFAAYVAAGA